jgi:hypothetical protein
MGEIADGMDEAGEEKHDSGAKAAAEKGRI